MHHTEYENGHQTRGVHAIMVGHTHERRRDKRPVKRDIVFAEDGQYYGCITKMLGNCRVMVQRSDDGSEVMCKIRGSMQKRVYLSVNDWVLVCDRDALAGSTGDVVHKYTALEANYLVKIGEIVKQRPSEDDSFDDDIEFEQTEEDFVNDI